MVAYRALRLGIGAGAAVVGAAAALRLADSSSLRSAQVPGGDAARRRTQSDYRWIPISRARRAVRDGAPPPKTGHAEFRVCLPASTEEFSPGQFWMSRNYERKVNADMASELEPRSGNGSAAGSGTRPPAAVFWRIPDRPYDNRGGGMPPSTVSDVETPRNAGQHSLKEFHLASRVPAWLKALLPAEALIIQEESWNAYPHLFSVVTSKYLDPRRFKIVVQSTFLDDDGGSANALNAPGAVTRARRVERLDICRVDEHPEHFYDEESDPRLKGSAKAGRGPWARGLGWTKEECSPGGASHPVCCAYKMVSVRFDYLSAWIAERVIETILAMYTKNFTGMHAMAAARMDEWYGQSRGAIRAAESQWALPVIPEEERRGAEEHCVATGRPGDGGPGDGGPGDFGPGDGSAGPRAAAAAAVAVSALLGAAAGARLASSPWTRGLGC
jgi:hypothetical protein